MDYAIWYSIQGESLPRGARQINRGGVNEQNSIVMGGDVDRRNKQKHFCVEEPASFSHGGG